MIATDVGDRQCSIRHTYTVHAGIPGPRKERDLDQLSPIWNLLDQLPNGRSDWYAGNDSIAAPGVEARPVFTHARSRSTVFIRSQAPLSRR